MTRFYIHIPFCRQKCTYCKFALTPVFNSFKKNKYLKFLSREIEQYFIENPWIWVSTIYFWWWTPSVLSLSEIQELLSLFPYTWPREVSFECNPEDVTKEYILWILDLGVNRISLGIQSLNRKALEKIGRYSEDAIFWALHSLGQIGTSSKANFSLSVDFILWLPYVSPWEILRNIKEIHKKFPWITHTSVYMLEKWIYPKDWKNLCIDEVTIENEYIDICRYFKEIWWKHYEISNWSKPWYECSHNLWYWNHETYRWFWLSATSYSSLKRWQNSSGFLWYYNGEVDYEEYLNEKELFLEKVIYGIRTFSLKSKYFDIRILRDLEQEGYISVKNGNIVLTPTWIFRENSIISSLLDATVAQW